jgi:spoIIIJ-associated protein
MVASYEFEAKTKEEAVRKACEELGISEDKLDIEVVSYGSTGIFGLVGAKKAKIKVTLPEVAEPEPEPKPEEEKEEITADVDDVVELARRTLQDIISFVLDGAVVTAAKDGHGLRLRIETDNPAILIGRHGRTLDALQYVVRKIVRKKTNTKMPIAFDVEGYRDRRKESLTQLALRLGEKVKRSGKPATISPMNAYDRRIVHVALKDDAAVKTQSRGGGLFRKLVIFPQKKQR